MITAGIGRFGPYLKHGTVYKSLAKDDDVLTIGLNRAVSLLAEPRGARRGGAAPGKPLGNHPADDKPVTLHEGRYGPYVKHGKINATLPKSLTPGDVTLEQALPLLEERAVRGGGGRKTARRPIPKAAAAKTPKPKAAKKKAAAAAAAPNPKKTASE
jgi:DNA topoisomerase I